MANESGSGGKALSIPSMSTTSLSASQSVHSHALTLPSIARTVVTSPPWARDEPPSPTDNADELGNSRHTADSRPSDVGSLNSSSVGATGPAHDSHWWTFARPRHSNMDAPHVFSENDFGRRPSMPEKKVDRSSWLLPGNRRSQDVAGILPTEKLKLNTTLPRPLGVEESSRNPTIPPPSVPFTMSHSMTPGWDTPWQPVTGRGNYSHIYNNEEEKHSDNSSGRSGYGGSGKKRLRAFILTNIYVPLLFRFINVTFTTAALAIAIRIRIWELRSDVMGIVGSSPTLVIIFAPLTLVHVMVAIYLEYFGRPVGLWRTSGKLAHTLLEVFFICAWSAALSLCFDNFFTSLIPCASFSSTSWYNELPRPQLPNVTLTDLGRGEGGVGDTICDNQLALICLVGVGLIMYCINLVISLFRIFEKVKYHGARLGA
ncbi:hypothetical protein SERLA73DRAFT_184916 [Serpula lacrymans var. lacrymans S7.3]|uniref:Uncharacterized protein n=2 Tax=Serpula lacrymans var. lacrymans TaxID=341189 RepID=F8Q3P9_SERL3|nr:uncharacterized protein SERLADRAFT_473093 [Serpula lacrymans var. lacrymans S7.9]EGN96755.1 hypothetical protein SERLA73DRAFT_184916 [Serpula lacrymans var. lacrymans S7.3]EGO22361.1 hypothetical protein SERLADRAFT_473093 [Serpula lacrymans var. lacrymans S7.9]